MDPTYTFGNGIRVRRSDLIPIQLERYASPGNPNLHEPIEERWLLNTFVKELPASPVFLDIGAGIGYYSALVKMRWPEALIFAVEALPRHREAISVTMELNGFNPADVSIYPVALAGSTGTGTFVDEGFGSFLDSRRRPGVQVQIVRTRSLDSLLQELPPVHMMKMDIQGAELETLTASPNALARYHVRHAVIGTHGFKLHHEVRAVLETHGYSIVFDDPAPAMQPDGLIIATLR